VSAAVGGQMARSHAPTAVLDLGVLCRLDRVVALTGLASLDWPQEARVNDTGGSAVGRVDVWGLGALAGAALTPGPAVTISALVGANAVRATLTGSGVDAARGLWVFRPQAAVAAEGAWAVTPRWSAFVRLSAAHVWSAPTFTVRDVAEPVYSAAAWTGCIALGMAGGLR
jgi:hypothetical protein